MKVKSNFAFYLYLQQKLLENCNGELQIDYNKLKMKLINIKIPKTLIPILLREMEYLELGFKLNKFKFQITNENKSKGIKKLLER